MRTLFAPVAVLITLSASAQPPYGREKVVEVDTVTSAEVLRATARKWFVDTFRDANEVVKMDDAATNTIVGKGWTEYGPNGALHYTIEVVCKKGRARVRVYDVQHEGRGSVYTAAGPMAVQSWGALFDEERCFVPFRINSMQSEAAAEKQMLKTCKAERPEIDKRLDAITASIEAALKAPKAASSDW